MQDIVYKLKPDLLESKFTIYPPILVTILSSSEEMKREKEFYEKRGLPYPKANLLPPPESKDNPYKITIINPNDATNAGPATNGTSAEEPTITKTIPATSCPGTTTDDLSTDKIDYHRSDEQVNILLENHPGCTLKPVKRKYIRCSAHTTITHIKKFVSQKLYNNSEKHREVSFDISLKSS